jgi:nicotinamide mononucleotide (NMN) deamidase PncC
MTAFQVICRILAIGTALASYVGAGLSITGIAGGAGGAAAGVLLLSSIATAIGGTALALFIWWMGDVRGYLDDIRDYNRDQRSE